MNKVTPYYIMLFKGVSYALKAEKILKAQGIPHKLIPVPKQISTDCGVCLRFEPSFHEAIHVALSDKVDFEQIHPLPQ